MNSSFIHRAGYTADDAVLNLLWAMSVSIYLVGGCGGAFAAGWLADTFGRSVNNALWEKCVHLHNPCMTS